MKLRTLGSMATSLMNRSRFGLGGSITFGGKRDLFEALGYKRVLRIEDYWARYQRNGVAARIIEAKPQDTFRGGGELIEDQDPQAKTEFESAWVTLDRRLKVWSMFQKADILSGIGQYAVIVLGAPGKLDMPLESCKPEDLKFLTAYAQDDAVVTEFDKDPYSERFGLPTFYTIKRAAVTPLTGNSSNGNGSQVVGTRVHHSRVHHVAEVLDDRTYAMPRLMRVWNLLDDLEKVTGGGAEAFWKRADAGMQIALDPTMNLSEGELEAMRDETDDYIHGLKRVVRTRGVEMKQLGSDVANLGPSAEAIVAQLSASTGIPQRILMGSEQAKLAAIQDRSNWDERIEARRTEYAEPYIVRPFINKLIDLGVLPTPKNLDWFIGWSQVRTMDDGEKADLGNRLADINQKAGTDVVLPNEIREVLGLKSRSDFQETAAPGGGPTGKMTGAEEHDGLMRVLEAAIEHDKPAIIEHVLGLKMPTTVVTASGEVDLSPLSAQMTELSKLVIGKASSDQVLVKGLESVATAITTAMAAQKAPVVNVRVDAPVRKAVVKTVERDAQGLITKVTEA